MTDTPWTPGPWEVQDDGSIIAPDVAVILMPDAPFDGDAVIPTEADTCLISVAPEMADWVDEVLTFVRGRDVPTLTVNHLRQGMSLLARARGET